MMDFVLPPLVALAVWWFGTGVVMLLDRLPRETFRFTLFSTTLIVGAGLVCIARAAHNDTPAGAYGAFVCAVMVWGWHELTFLSGWLTGPRKRECSAPGHWPTRLRESVHAILWHEMGLIGALALIWALTREGSNPVALWTFALLWVMRLSAKLNLFLGVRNFGEEFLPSHLSHLPSYFKRRGFNPLLPAVVGAGGALAVQLVMRAAELPPGLRTGHLLVATLLGLAVIEHLLLVLPLRSSALWRWAMQRQVQQAAVADLGAR
jgi:putative photosynthetic complex assembly protein 2